MSAPAAPDGSFCSSREAFGEIVAWLEGSEAAGLDHAGLEAGLDSRGRELLRRMLQDHLNLRTAAETRVEVTCSEGVSHRSVEAGHARPLLSIFGPVNVERLAYRHRVHANLYPGDAELNLPVELHSHGLRRLAAVEATRGSYDDASAAIGRATGQGVAKRQVEGLTARASIDVESFYATCPRSEVADTDVVILSVDGKGIVMRPDALRPATAKAAAETSTKLAGRLSKGEKRNRKRMAEVGAVYDLAPQSRTAAQVMAAPTNGDPPPSPPPAARNKWVTASVIDDAATVVADVFDQAERRDPGHQRRWVALVDGNNHQINRIRAEAANRGIDMAIVIDVIHVIEYLWAAAWCFYPEADPAAETWVRDKTLAVLEGRARDVAAGIRRRASTLGLPAARRIKADTAATYLTNKADYLDYPTALAAGWPIATGVIEGACRHLVADRMDITGRPLERHRSRSRPQAPSHQDQRRLRRLHALPPRPRTATQPPSPLRRRRATHSRMTSLYKSRTLLS